MERTRISFLRGLGLLTALAALILAGCATPPADTADDADTGTAAETGTTSTADQVGGGSDRMSWSTADSWRGFPATALSQSEAAIVVSREVPERARPNTNILYNLRVTNNASYPVDNVVITETLPAGLTLVSSSVTPQREGNNLIWALGRMNPKQSQIITITIRPTETGTIRLSADTKINYRLGQLSESVRVIEPALELMASAPRRVLVEDLIPVTMNVRNSGTAPIEGARLVHNLPQGLLTEEGRSRIEMLIGDLAPNESQSVSLSLRGVTVGTYQPQFTVVDENDVSASTSITVSVTRPELQITAEAPSMRFVGDIITYEVTVRNTGDGVAHATTVRQILSEGTALASADQGGEANGNVVIWEVGNLQPGESKTLSSRVLARQIINARSVAIVEAERADRAEDAVTTDVQGVSALLLEVSDTHDPVPLGEEEIYVVTVTNQGSLAATSVQIEAVLEEGMEFIQSTGATKMISVDGRTVTFESLPALDPQAEAVWRIRVKATAQGDVRFDVSLNSEQLERPVREAESTLFYE